MADQGREQAVEAVLGMEMLDPAEDGPDESYVKGYNDCLAVVRSYLEADDA